MTVLLEVFGVEKNNEHNVDGWNSLGFEHLDATEWKPAQRDDRRQTWRSKAFPGQGSQSSCHGQFVQSSDDVRPNSAVQWKLLGASPLPLLMPRRRPMRDWPIA